MLLRLTTVSDVALFRVDALPHAAPAVPCKHHHRCSRERNRVHARKSRLRKKFFVDSLKANLEGLDEENRRWVIVYA